MKSLEELKALREQMKGKVGIRHDGDSNIRVVVGMATCGIAAGARPVLAAFTDEMKSRADLYEIEGNKLTAYNAALDALKAMPFSTAEEIRAIMTAVYQIQNNAKNYASGHATTRIAEEMANLNNVLDAHLSRYYIDKEGWIPAESIRPDRVNPPKPDPDPDDGDDDDNPPAPAPEKGCGCGSSIGVATGGAALILLLVGLSVAFTRKRKQN